MEMTGVEVQNENYTISGSLMKQTIVSSGTLQLQTIATVKQSLIISKIYYAGSKDLNNKNYGAGKYVEFYNNSDQAVNIAGLYFGLIESDASPAYMLGTTPDYLYLKQIFRFPTTGRTEIQPGETVLVANSAIDHTQAATQEKNLSEADFEVKQADNTNNPAIPAVYLIYTAFRRTAGDVLIYLLRAECTYPAVCFKKLLIMRLCYGYSYNSSIIIRNYYNTTENMRINR